MLQVHRKFYNRTQFYVPFGAFIRNFKGVFKKGKIGEGRAEENCYKDGERRSGTK